MTMRRAVRRLSTLPAADAVLHRSRIPTLHFQQSLPKLPLPPLAETLTRLLYAAEPITTSAEYAEAKALADDFGATLGPQLQEALVARDKSRYSSFISEPWFELYLKDTQSLLLNYNPQLTFKDEEVPERATQVGRAARLVHAATTFQRTLERGLLEPDVFHTAPNRSQTSLFNEVVRLLPQSVSFYGAAACGAYPLDMSQYGNLFRSTRIPRAGLDELVVAEGSRHIVVQRGGRMWRLDVLDATGGSVPLDQLHNALQAIIDAADAEPAPADEHVGLLTSLPRDEWAALRERISATPAAEGAAALANEASLAAVDSALFVLGLEREAPGDDIAVSRCFLHGDGVDRWLDKSFSLLVSSNGKAAINFEHAWGDGVAVLRFFNEVHAAAAQMPVLPPSTYAASAAAAPPDPLPFQLSPDVKQAVVDARKRFDATIGRTELAALRTEDFNTKMLKGAKLSPDGAMQMSFQLAHTLMHGGPLPSTYESASTAAFKHGRTETIRSATPEAALFTRAFLDPSTSLTDRAAALKVAVDNHSRITREALTGNGFDRHLFALDHVAQLQGRTHDLFSCAAIAKLRHIILSTSTLNSEALSNGGFGPVNDDCYAIGYGIRSYGAEARVMTYGRDSQGYVDCLQKAMGLMEEAAVHSARAESATKGPS